MSQQITDFLEITDSQLVMEGHRLTDIAAEFGTPLFVTSENTIRKNVRTFYDAFRSRYPQEVVVCVGTKANYSLACRKIVVSEGGGADTFGLGELYVTMLAGTERSKVVINGSNKSREVLEAALSAGIIINVDAFDEFEELVDLAAAHDTVAKICPRMRMPLKELDGKYFVDPRYPAPGVEVSRWHREYKFGMEPTEVFEMIKAGLRSDHIDVVGLQYHGGIPRRAGFSYEETQEAMQWFAEFKTKLDWEPRVLNMGGGFPKTRPGVENEFSLQFHAENITAAIIKATQKLGLTLPMLYLEPGRWCWEDATVYLTRVGSRKQDRMITKKKWVYVDGSINDMSDPFDPFQAYHHALIADRADAETVDTVDICGPLCNAGDILAKERPFPAARRGDVVAFLSMGGYNEMFANQANAMPRSASVLLNGNKTAVIRRRETVQDVFARDRVPSWLL
jgi:diaminopimelate decarboxylase